MIELKNKIKFFKIWDYHNFHQLQNLKKKKKKYGNNLQVNMVTADLKLEDGMHLKVKTSMTVQAS